jgi:transposase
MVQTALEANPFCGHVFVFRGRRGDMLKILWFDGQGLLLLEGIDWRMPMRTDQPALAA